MSNFTHKLKQKKGISPVIATIILIAVALVLALVVGLFAFGLFTSNAKSVAAKSGNLYVANTQFDFTLSNPSAAPTDVISVTLTGVGVTGCTGTWTTVAPGTVTPESCTTTGTPIMGAAYDYTINLQNGQSISGTVIAQ